jgi:hypothetical protein
MENAYAKMDFMKILALVFLAEIHANYALL